MTTTVPLECTCGSLRGEARASPNHGIRIVCMCDDCQAYAHWLERADEILDRHGGTEVLQTTPAQLVIHQGAEQLRCMRLTPRGPLRWYTGCCKTPVANTAPWPKIPFAGVLCVLIKLPAGGSLDQALGPVRARLHGRFGHGTLPPGSHPRAPAGLILRAIRTLIGGWIRRAYTPSPFFDAATGTPVAEPTVVSEQERTRLLELAHAGG